MAISCEGQASLPVCWFPSGNGWCSIGAWYGMVIGFKLWLYFVQHRHELSGGPVTPWDAFVGLFKGYEEAVFVPLWKLKDVADYHERASVHTRVHRIARPLLVVHSRDDPVVPGASSSLFLYIYIYIYMYICVGI